MWNEYRAVTSDRAHAYAGLVEHFGYGGMIHAFKNFVIRQSPEYLDRAEISADLALAALSAYNSISDLSDEERQAVGRIRETLNDYREQLPKVARRISFGRENPQTIDAAVVVNDDPALEGLATLHDEVVGTGEVASHTRMILLGEIRSALGYGGMVHQLKNYVLRQDAPRIARVSGAIEDFRDWTAEYRALGISPDEEAALRQLEGVVDAYAAALDQAISLVSEGLAPEVIDSQIGVDDGPGLEALAQLTSLAVDHMATTAESLEASLSEIERLSLAITVAALGSALILGGLFFHVLIRRTQRPIARLHSVVAAVAAGDLSVDVPPIDRPMELRDMADAVKVFRTNAIEKAELQEKQKETEQQAEAKKRAAMVTLTQNFETGVGEVVQSIASSVADMRAVSQSMSVIAQDASGKATTVAAAAALASENVQAVASAAEQLGSSIAGISQQMNQQISASEDAGESAVLSDREIRGLADKAEEIGSVVSLITGIAEQTNLLALNATIEAARAGEAGKGFSVVAAEVKNLANQTGKATEEIAAQIQGVQEQTSRAVDAIAAINARIERIREISSSVAAAVEEQHAAANEIGRNTQEASAGTRQVTSLITGVSDASHQTGDNANSVLSSTEGLSQQAEQLSDQVSRFVESLRVA